ncbi:MAG: sugar ABC transporter permease [Clostridia bacterium]|nr:sugar ABC transporter permease [Clostridia bacterium]
MKKGKFSKEKLSPYLYMSPALMSIFILSLLPVVYTVYIAFTNYNLNHMEDYGFGGIENFRLILTGSLKPIFLPVFLWTFIFAAFASLGGYFIGLVLALVLNNPNMKETKVYRAILIVPWALPSTIAVLAWQGLLNESYGGINGMLKLLHLPNEIPWLTDPFWARTGVIIITLWLGFPFMLNVCLGVLQSIPPSIYEAADIDGARWWDKFKCITMPCMISASLPLLISSFAFNFNNIGAAFLVTQGNPPRMGTQFAGYTDILTSAGYRMTTQSFRYDLASALSVLVFLVIGTITLVNMKLTRSFEEVD